VLESIKSSSGHRDAFTGVVQSEFAKPFVDGVVSKCADALPDVLRSEIMDSPLDMEPASVRVALVIGDIAAARRATVDEVFIRFVLGSPSMVRLPVKSLTSISPVNRLLEGSEPMMDYL
jgi:hypothetical protein